MTDLSQQTEPRSRSPRIVDDEQIQFYVDNGYLVVPDLMTGDELQELKDDLVDVARGKYPCRGLVPPGPDDTDDDVLQRILCIHQPHFVSEVIEKYVRHPKICGVLSQITAAPHLPYWDGSVKCMQSMYFIKPPRFQGQAWHQDEIFIPTRDRSLIGAWIAVDDATIENGCLYVIPGSHRNGYLYPQRAHENPDEFDFAPGKPRFRRVRGGAGRGPRRGPGLLQRLSPASFLQEPQRPDPPRAGQPLLQRVEPVAVGYRGGRATRHGRPARNRSGFRHRPLRLEGL